MFGDLDGDRKADVCGRHPSGIYCARSTGSAFQTASLATSSYSDANGWNQRTYYGSLKLADVNGDGRSDICGRSSAGIHCAMNNGSGAFVSPLAFLTSSYNNASGWYPVQYGSTVMFGDINGDGRDDVCGRGVHGLYCSVSKGNAFGPPIMANTFLSDVNGWAHENYYRAIRLADIDGDGRADVCGRGGSGLHCGIATLQFQ
jgi:hypothetical protein